MITTLTIYGLGSINDNIHQIIPKLIEYKLNLNDLDIQYFNLMDNDHYQNQEITLGTIEFLGSKGLIYLDDFIDPVIFKGNKLL